MANVIQLPVYDPFIKGYVHHACCFSAVNIEDRYEDQLWFANNFIQVFCNKDVVENRESGLDFCHESFFSAYEDIFTIQKLHKNIMKNYSGGVIRFLTDRIDEQTYIELMVNEYFLPKTSSYQKNHFSHNIFIYGYNEREELFYARYMINGHFSDSTIPYPILEQAFTNTNETENWATYSKLYRKETYDLKFDGRRLAGFLSDYLYSRNHYRDSNNMKNAYGLETYEYIMEYIRHLESGLISNDIRLLHLLWEHKKSMAFKIHFFAKHKLLEVDNSLLEQVDLIEKQSLIIRNMQLKNQLKNDKSLFKRINEIIFEIKERELDIYSKLLDTRL